MRFGLIQTQATPRAIHRVHHGTRWDAACLTCLACYASGAILSGIAEIAIRFRCTGLLAWCACLTGAIRSSSAGAQAARDAGCERSVGLRSSSAHLAGSTIRRIEWVDCLAFPHRSDRHTTAALATAVEGVRLGTGGAVLARSQASGAVLGATISHAKLASTLVAFWTCSSRAR